MPWICDTPEGMLRVLNRLLDAKDHHYQIWRYARAFAASPLDWKRAENAKQIFLWYLNAIELLLNLK